MKYILKKEYPGSPKLGNIIDNLENDWIENYPEFWEEVVVKKDYEILSLARFCSIKPTITDVSDYGDEFIEAMLKCDNARIHSIKRLSDSEIFTIGDIIDTRVDNKYKQEILEINLGINDLLLKDKLIFKTKSGYVVSHIAVKVKKPLFTTEDGLDIFEGDKIYSIDKTKLVFKDIDRIIQSQYFERSSLYKYFSTKEKAEEYILLNKPCLSYNEVLNATKIRNKNTFETLKDLVKSKIQQSV